MLKWNFPNLIIQKIKNLILILVLILQIKLGSILDIGVYMVIFNTGNELPYNQYFVHMVLNTNKKCTQ
jgi:hypothetical protein